MKAVGNVAKVFDELGRELSDPELVLILDARKTSRIDIELFDAGRARVTTFGLDLPPEVAATVVGVRILAPGEE
jgi:uncharacterized protein YciU (UPF0263 family)